MRPNVHIHFHYLDRFNLPEAMQLQCKSKVKKWAFDNAWTLILMAILFVITWGWIFYLGVKNSVA